MKHVRNVAIILALGALVYLAPAARVAAGLLSWVLGVVFLGILVWFAAVMYRQHRAELLSLDDRMRALLYASIGVAVLTVTATSRLWQTPIGTVGWIVLLAAASFGVYSAWRSFRTY